MEEALFMSLTARILTPIELPEKVQVEIKDTVRGATQTVTIDFHKAMQELGALGAVDLQEVDPAELITMACAVAKHRAIDQYLMSIGVDPHAEVKPLEES
jgi:hypothetical protein